MAVAYKSAGAGVSTETSGGALSPLCPAVVDANDILIAHVYWEGTATAPSTPSGWTLLDGPQVVETTIGRVWTFGKIAAGTEDGAAVAFGAPAVTTQRGARVYSFSGYVSGTIDQLAKGFAFLSHATDPQMPTVTTTAAGALAVALVAQNDNNAAADATGETGGDWVEAVAEYVAALTPGLMLQIQTCMPTANPGTVTGGTVATTNDPCGVVGFQILAEPGSILESNADTASLTETFVKSYQAVRDDTLAFTEGFTKLVQRTLAESVVLTESLTAARVVLSDVSDAVSLADSLAVSVGKAASETVALAETFVKQTGKTINDTLGLTEGLAAARVTLREIGDTLGVTEALTKWLGLSRVETVTLTESLEAQSSGGGAAAPGSLTSITDCTAVNRCC